MLAQAPEVYRRQEYNEKADCFSFAVIAYELLHRYMIISTTDGSMEECQVCAFVVCGARGQPVGCLRRRLCTCGGRDV